MSSAGAPQPRGAMPPVRHPAAVEDGAGGHQALRLWLRMLACTHQIETEIRARMRSNFNCTLPRFDLMSQLARHPEGLKMGEISRRLMVTGGNITGITDQLVKEGQVTREPLANDRRAFLVKLTPAGRKAFQRMAQEHERWVAELLADFPEPERRQLHALLGSLKSTLTRTSP